jgi:hypothetical protein
VKRNKKWILAVFNFSIINLYLSIIQFEEAVSDFIENTTDIRKELDDDQDERRFRIRMNIVKTQEKLQEFHDVVEEATKTLSTLLGDCLFLLSF